MLSRQRGAANRNPVRAGEELVLFGLGPQQWLFGYLCRLRGGTGTSDGDEVLCVTSEGPREASGMVQRPSVSVSGVAIGLP